MSSREDMIGIARLEGHHQHPGRAASIMLRVCSKLRIKFNCLQVAGTEVAKLEFRVCRRYFWGLARWFKIAAAKFGL